MLQRQKTILNSLNALAALCSDSVSPWQRVAVQYSYELNPDTIVAKITARQMQPLQINQLDSHLDQIPGFMVDEWL